MRPGNIGTFTAPFELLDTEVMMTRGGRSSVTMTDMGQALPFSRLWQSSRCEPATGRKNCAPLPRPFLPNEFLLRVILRPKRVQDQGLLVSLLYPQDLPAATRLSSLLPFRTKEFAATKI
jgi:hypothetical protein